MCLFTKSIPVMGKHLKLHELDCVWYTSEYVNVM